MSVPSAVVVPVQRGDHAGYGFRLAAVAVAVVGLVVAFLLIGPTFDPEGRRVFSDIATIPVALTVPLAAAYRARRCDPRLRRPWTLIAVAGALWAAGEMGWFLNHYLAAVELDPSPADLLSLAGTVPAGAALLRFPRRSGFARHRVIRLLGSLVIVGSVLFVARTVSLEFAVGGETGPWLARLVYVAYPTTDLVLFCLALIALVRSAEQVRCYLVLLVLGIVSYTTADVGYAIVSSTVGYDAGQPLDLGWFVGYLLMALATLAPGAGSDEVTAGSPTRRRHTRGWTGLLVYVPVLLAAVAASAFPTASPDPLLIVCGVGILAAFGVRQALLAGDLARSNELRDEQLTILQETGARLRHQVQQTERITASVADGIVVLDPARRVTMANASATRLLHLASADLVGCPLESLLADGVEQQAVLQAVDRGSVLIAHAAKFRSTGSLDVELTLGPLGDGDGSPGPAAGRLLGTVMVLRDVTERRAVERLKDEFVSVVSHELRTPLTSIRGSLALLNGGMGGELEPAGARMIALALQSSERLTRLIDDLLDMERMESGRLTMAPEYCQAARLVELATRELGALAQDHGVDIVRLQCSGRVWADPDRIVQTLVNLISNAIKFSPAGSQVRVAAWPSRDQVEFSVADRGRGIPPDKLDLVFERFEQVDSSDSRQKGGTGLGLAISRNIVQLHGGRIWVNSQLGEGSDFRFVLPSGSPADAESAAPPADRVMDAGRRTPAPR